LDRLAANSIRIDIDGPGYRQHLAHRRQGAGLGAARGGNCVSDKAHPGLTLQLPPLDGPTAAWILDLCGHLQTAIWRAYGDQIEAHGTEAEPGQPIYGRLQPAPRRKR
jgi:hypothetical protein